MTSTASALHGTFEVPCTPLDGRLVDSVIHYSKVQKSVGRVWPGYWGSNQTAIFYVPAQAALMVSAAPPPPPFQLVQTSPGHPLQGRLFYACGKLAGLTGNFDQEYKIGGLDAVAVPISGSPQKTVDDLFHEGFHTYQRAHFARTVGADTLPLQGEARGNESFLQDPQFIASMEVERRVLAAAVIAPKRSTKLALIRDYLALKEERSTNLPTPLRHTEINVERKEGSASIVGREMANLAYGYPLEEPSQQIWTLLAEAPESLLEAKDAYARFRARAFGAGATAAWLLTRLGIDWREPLQKGASFESLLAAAARYKPAERRSLAEAAKARWNIEGLVTEAKKWADAHKSFTQADFFSLRPYRLSVTFPKIGASAPSYAVTHSGIASVPEEDLLIFADTRVAKLDYGPVRLESEERPLLVDQRAGAKKGEYSFSLMMNEMPQLTGFKGRPGKISADGLLIVIDRPATVERDLGSITVRITDR